MAAGFRMDACVAGEAAASLQDDPPVEFDAPADDDAAGLPGGRVPWRILVADDDEDVHSATAFALTRIQVDGRPLELLHAHSAAEAEALLRAERGIAVAMLDVVMETQDAGLRLVELIRNELELSAMRIVLRTGQPGYAPELEVIQKYDINDYRTKSELNRTRLVTTLTAALRAYEQIESERVATQAMDALARSAGTLMQSRDGPTFAIAVLQRLESVLGSALDAFVALEEAASSSSERGLHVLAARGAFSSFSGAMLDKVLDVELGRSVRRAMAARTCIFESSRFTLWIGNSSRDAVVVVDHREPMRPLQRKLIGVLSETLGVIFENVDLIERLEFFAFCDPLTRLPNRTRFISDVDQDLFAHPGAMRRLLLVDILGFSGVNENLGLRCGDSLLSAVGRRLRGLFPQGVFVARIGADSFAMFGPESLVSEEALSHAFDAPFFIHGHVVALRLHVGCLDLANCQGNAVELLRNASLALNAARRSGNGCARHFEPGMAESLQHRSQMLHSLRASIDFRRGLSLHYQPILNARDERVIGIEVFARWRDESGANVAPACFIPLAEQSGLIDELGRWTMEQAFERVASLRRTDWSDLKLVLNVSGIQLRSPDFLRDLTALLDVSNLPADCLTLDLGRDVVGEKPELLLRQLKALSGMGIGLALDDFTPLLASPSALSGWPIDTLKLAMSAVQPDLGSEAGLRFVESLKRLARLRGLDFLVKGVELPEQVSRLVSLGCEQQQGFHFAKPMSGDVLETWLRGRLN